LVEPEQELEGGGHHDEVGEGEAGEIEQQVVLPEAEHKRHPEYGGADDQPVAQLVEVLDERVAISAGNRPWATDRHLRALRPGRRSRR
jgi:hypothetical protein